MSSCWRAGRCRPPDAWSPGTARRSAPWAAELDGADVVINLAGRSVNCRYTPANRAAMLDSRVRSTRVVGEAIAQAARPPRGVDPGQHGDDLRPPFEPAHDEHGTIGGDEPGAPDTWRFSIEVAKAWERALDAASTPRTRKVALRSAMTMSPDRGGMFDTLLGAGAARPRRDVGRRPAVRLVGAPRGLRPRRPLADRARRRRRRGQRLRARTAAQRGVHARAARGLGHAHRPARGRRGCSSSGRSSCAPRPSSS